MFSQGLELIINNDMSLRLPAFDRISARFGLVVSRARYSIYARKASRP